MKSAAARVLVAVSWALAASTASAQGVITPNTEPSSKTVNNPKANPSSAEGAGTVTSRSMSNGVTPGQGEPGGTAKPAAPQGGGDKPHP